MSPFHPPVARAAAKREVLRAVAAHDGEWYWYQVDRAVSGRRPDCIGPFFAEIRELAAEGLIEIRPRPDVPGGERYWLTDAGKSAIAEQRRAEPAPNGGPATQPGNSGVA